MPGTVRRTDSNDARQDGATPFADLPVAPLTHPWDAAAARRRLLGPDGDQWDRYFSGHLWVDRQAIRERGSPTQADAKLPIADLIDGRVTVVWDGLVAAVAAINGARTPLAIPAADKRAAFNHAIRYYRKINQGLPEAEAKQIPEYQGDACDPDERKDGRVPRFDRLGDLRPMHRTPEGFLQLEGFAARPGVLRYQYADGTVVRELVPPEELHRPDSLASLGQATLTLEHPAVDVDPDNVAALGVGNVGDEIDVLKDTGFVRVRMVARRADAIQDVEAGTRRELSPGYSVRIDPTPGVHPEYGPYDAIQRDRRYNHLAIVTAARGGPQIQLRADAAVQVLEPGAADGSTRTDNHEDPTMIRLLLPLLVAALTGAGVPRADADELVKPLTDADKADGDNHNDAATPATQLVIDTLSKALDKLGAQLAESNTALQTMTGERDALQSQVDQLKAAKPADGTMPPEDEEPKLDALLTWHQERTQLEALAAVHLPDVKADELAKLDSAALRGQLVKAIRPNTTEEQARSDSYARAFLDLYQEQTRSPWAVQTPEIRKDATDGAGKGHKPVTHVDTLTTAFDARKDGHEADTTGAGA